MTGILLINPRAGGGAWRVLPRLRRALGDAGLNVEVVATDAPEQLTDRLTTGCDRLVVAGGDGTVNSALAAAIHAKVPLAVIPVGTANGVARELGVPLTIEGACRVAATGRICQVDYGRANGRPFLLMAGVGFDAEVVRRVGQPAKNALGPFAYVAAGLFTIAHYRPVRMRLSAEGVASEICAHAVIAANAETYTYDWRVAPGASLTDGMLDVCIFAEAGWLGWLSQLSGILRHRRLNHSQVRRLRARALRVEARPTVSVQVDGDSAGQTPVEIDVVPGGIAVVVPEDART
jgi:diacylglycerol kinase (ATP)